VLDAVGRAAPTVPVAIVRLTVDGVRPAEASLAASAALPVADLGPLLAVSAIGDPRAFEAQLAAAGARLRERVRFPDHHPFTDAEVDRLVRSSRGCAGVVCTLKDAVKLAPRWPVTAVPLWYVSQAVQVVSGREVLVGGIDRLLAARPAAVPTAG
jgi:tetraacyldisaccharide 4'-kinase